jgi:hypothetical protein
MMKNCGEHVHFEVVEQHVLQEMVKLVQKRVLSLFPAVAIIMVAKRTKCSLTSFESIDCRWISLFRLCLELYE